MSLISQDKMTIYTQKTQKTQTHTKNTDTITYMY